MAKNRQKVGAFETLAVFRSVLVHKCFNPEVATAPPAIGCKCKKFISTQRREELLARGEIRYVIEPGRKGTPVNRTSEVVVLRKATQTPRTATIEKAHIERAFCHGNEDHEIKAGQRERERLEAYGAMTEAMWAGAGKSGQSAATRIRGNVSQPVSIAPPIPDEGAVIAHFADPRTNAHNSTGSNVSDLYRSKLVDLYRLGSACPDSGEVEALTKLANANSLDAINKRRISVLHLRHCATADDKRAA